MSCQEVVLPDRTRHMWQAGGADVSPPIHHTVGAHDIAARHNHRFARVALTFDTDTEAEAKQKVAKHGRRGGVCSRRGNRRLLVCVRILGEREQRPL